MKFNKVKKEFESGENHGVEDDNVSHPSHYCFGGIEVIDAIEDWNLNFHLSNAIKYIVRAGKKDPSKEIEDIQKAVWYLNRYISWKEKKQGVNLLV